MRIQDRLVESIAEHVSSVAPPMPDLAETVRRGRRLRRRRNLAVSTLVAVVAVGGGTMAIQAAGLPWLESAESRWSAASPETFAPVGRLDYSGGLRAYASPDEDGELSIGGRDFPVEDMGHLDTDATATSYGLLFFDRAHQAHLLDESGRDLVLGPAPIGGNGDFRPSAKADARLPLVAFTQPADDGVTVRLHALDTRRPVGTLDVPCSGSGCGAVRVEGVDRGLVFVRTEDGTFVWDPEVRGEDRWTLLGEGEFRVADVRNGHVLWAGAPPKPAPDSPVADWDFTRGEIDGELSHDGRYVLSWSPVLEPTAPGDPPVELRVRGAVWFTFDTDGTVLAMGVGDAETSPVYDCELETGACERIGSVSSRSGDPMFIGNDM